MPAGFAAIERRFDRFEERIDRRFDRVDERFDEFTGIVVDLAREVGEVKGRLAVSAPVEAFSRVDQPGGWWFVEYQPHRFKLTNT